MRIFWPILFFAVPILELYLLIQVGSMIGAGWTIALVIMTAALGVHLLRLQGLSTLQRAQSALSRGSLPAMEMLEGVMLAVGGAFLLTPGFFTDALGFLCLIPTTRRYLIKRVLSRASIVTMHGKSEQPRKSGPKTIEGEYWKED